MALTLPIFQHPDDSVSLDALNPQAIQSLQVKFATSKTLAWQFPDSSGTPQEIDAVLSITTFKFVCKKLGDFDGLPLVLNFAGGVWVVTKTGVGSAATYSISPSFKTTALFELLITTAGGVIKAPVADQAARFESAGLSQGNIVQQQDTVVYWQLIDPAQIANSAGWSQDVPLAPSVTLGAELEINLSGFVSKTAPFSIVVLADYVQGTEGLDFIEMPDYPAPGAIALRPLNNADIAVSSAADITLFTAGTQSTVFARVLAAAGSGAYVAKYSLPTASATDGELCIVNVELVASANPTVSIYNASSAGTLLQTITNPAPAAAAYWFGIFKFSTSSGAWAKLFGAFQ